MHRLLCRLSFLTAAAVVVACSDPDELPDATLTNTVDTLTLWSLSDGPLTQPTAYSLNNRNGVRTWEVGLNFEFAFDEDNNNAPVFLPISALGLLPTGSVKPGLRRSPLGFDQMTKAPLNGYVGSDTIPVAVGDNFFVRTTVSTCSFLGVPLYGKIHVFALDPVAHTVVIHAMANQNCGYRGLNIGIPRQ